MTIRIDQDTLEHACKSIIETILFCLPNAYKGTVYLIGGPPGLTATRITSGVIDSDRQSISWGLPQASDYNHPGKTWLEYRDEPNRPLEAMAWCVERQKSWTAEDPRADSRSVRLQVEGVWEDFHHMEPVLVRKKDLFINNNGVYPEFPKNSYGETLWQFSEHVVVAVIKIHFRPYTIRIGSPETRLIKKLSRTLGTELLSYQLKEQSLESMRHLAEDKIKACNILAHSIRNAITKSGLIFSLIKLELNFLREQWERIILQLCDPTLTKKGIIEELNKAAIDLKTEENQAAILDLIEVQTRFLELFLSPETGENWVHLQIEERWDELMQKANASDAQRQLIDEKIERLRRSLRLGKTAELLTKYVDLPAEVKQDWVELLYQNTDQIDLQYLERLIGILDAHDLKLPYQEKSRKTILRLKVLMEIMGELESDTNIALREVLNGKSKESHE
ncbi:conserved hypothetical protein [uncultured Desulfatiglans sp.]|uniref:Uncharacterized protein n=1 Tax=Uncultured Desulfatiglans sp. TaxID=1748965 RepID=A0A653A9M8_UNCDX|nr:conserved hypothetical protein [uncultured Desulfatiglans sp.]